MTTNSTQGAPTTKVGWVELVVVLASRMYRSGLLCLAAIALAPTLFGWGSYVIKSGSMEPSISVGDVVVAKPYSADQRVRVGRVFVFDDPATDKPHLLVHRVVELRDDGTYTTMGDANDVSDITPLPKTDITATAVLLTPYIGLPIAWMQAGEWVKLALWLMFSVAAFALASRDLPSDPPKFLRHRRPRLGPASTRRATLGVQALLVISLSLGSVTFATANAAFTARTSSAMAFTAGAGLLPYTKAVMTDKPAQYWLMDEAFGTQLLDRSGNNRGGLLTGGRVNTEGALPNNHGTSVSLRGGTDRIVSGGNAQSAPDNFTIEMWFRKDGGLGGKLAGFESSQSVSSGTADRTVFMRNSGRIVYGAWTAFGQRLIESPASYDDGAWHHLAVAVSTSGTSSSARMYIDGRLVDSGATTTPENYAGWWRVGYGNLPSIFFGYPLASMTADIDNFAIYNTALPETRIAAHYAAR